MAKKWANLHAQVLADPGQAARARRTKRVMEMIDALQAVRNRRGFTQKDVALAMHTEQPNISRLEHGDDFYVTSLVQYAEALGGELELRVLFPDESVILKPSEDGEPIDVIAAASPQL